MSSRLLILFIIFRAPKYGSVVGGLFSAIVPERLKGNGPGMHGVGTVYGHKWDTVHHCMTVYVYIVVMV